MLAGLCEVLQIDEILTSLEKRLNLVPLRVLWFVPQGEPYTPGQKVCLSLSCSPLERQNH